MITKKELTDLAIESLNGGPVQDYRKYHPAQVGRIVDICINSIIAQDVKQSEELGVSGVTSDWIQTINKIPVKFDSIREQCYIQWEQEILILQDNKGIREIGWQVSGDERGFNIMPSSSFQVFADLEASDPDGSGYTAIVEGKRVYFPQMAKAYATSLKAKVTARVVLAAASYDSTDILPIPEERMVEVKSLIDQLCAPQKATMMKVSNDSNPNTK
jgi:hypothetical protein